MSDNEGISAKPAVLVRGMGGLGDCIHQRAIIREYLKQYHVFLESPYVSVYHDFITQGLLVIQKSGTNLRVQQKNLKRELSVFYTGQIPQHKVIPIWYQATDVNKYKSVLEAMCRPCGINPATADFRLPIPQAWNDACDRHVIQRFKPTKPIMFYRPLVERKDWGGCSSRNPLYAVYSLLFNSIRDRFFVVSVADLEPHQEWLVGEDVKVDAKFNKGELSFEIMAALMRRSSLVYSSPGMALPLAQAVGTPNVCVFGGFEMPHSFILGAKYAPHLSIAPINPCGCWKHNHNCDKRIDLPKAYESLERFVNDVALTHYPTVAA